MHSPCPVQNVDNEALMVREDRALHADVGVREIVVSLLLCCEPHWLKLGLEMVTGEELPTKSGKSAQVALLRKFILEVTQPRGSCPAPLAAPPSRTLLHPQHYYFDVTVSGVCVTWLPSPCAV